MSDNKLKTTQHEVQRLLGRFLLKVQQYEKLIKAVMASHQLSGPLHDLEQARATQVERRVRETLGALVGDFLGSCVVAGPVNPSEETQNTHPDGVNWFSLKMNLGFPEAALKQVESKLKEMVSLRNNLVHHFIDQHDLWSLDGCRSAQDVLIDANNSIEQHVNQLWKWAKEMETMRQSTLDSLKSEKFKDAFVNGIASDGTVNWDTAGIVNAFREAFQALAVDGWAPVAEAGKWTAERYPEQLPAKYGCRSWRQVVHNASIFELEYFEIDGERTALYRVKNHTQKSQAHPAHEQQYVINLIFQ